MFPLKESCVCLPRYTLKGGVAAYLTSQPLLQNSRQARPLLGKLSRLLRQEW